MTGDLNIPLFLLALAQIAHGWYVGIYCNTEPEGQMILHVRTGAGSAVTKRRWRFRADL